MISKCNLNEHYYYYYFFSFLYRNNLPNRLFYYVLRSVSHVSKVYLDWVKRNYSHIYRTYTHIRHMEIEMKRKPLIIYYSNADSNDSLLWKLFTAFIFQLRNYYNVINYPSLVRNIFHWVYSSLGSNLDSHIGFPLFSLRK